MSSKTSKPGYNTFRIIIGVAFFVSILMYGLPFRSFFYTSVELDRIQYRANPYKGESSPITIAQIYNDQNVLLESDFDGALILTDTCDVILSRSGKKPLVIEITNDRDSVIGYLQDNDEKRVLLGDYVKLIYFDSTSLGDREYPLTHVFDGALFAGQNLFFSKAQTNGIGVIEGKLKIYGKSYFTNKYFETSEYDLELGDQLIFNNSADEVGEGKIYIDDQANMHLAYGILTRDARIIKTGPLGEESYFKIKSSAFEWLLQQNLFKTLALFFSFVVMITIFFNAYINYEKWK